jgi:hypothetical protein
VQILIGSFFYSHRQKSLDAALMGANIFVTQLIQGGKRCQRYFPRQPLSQQAQGPIRCNWNITSPPTTYPPRRSCAIYRTRQRPNGESAAAPPTNST